VVGGGIIGCSIAYHLTAAAAGTGFWSRREPGEGSRWSRQRLRVEVRTAPLWDPRGARVRI